MPCNRPQLINPDDLGHSFASKEIPLGRSLTMIGKLFRHRQPPPTARRAEWQRSRSSFSFYAKSR